MPPASVELQYLSIWLQRKKRALQKVHWQQNLGTREEIGKLRFDSGSTSTRVHIRDCMIGLVEIWVGNVWSRTTWMRWDGILDDQSSSPSNRERGRTDEWMNELPHAPACLCTTRSRHRDEEAGFGGHEYHKCTTTNTYTLTGGMMRCDRWRISIRRRVSVAKFSTFEITKWVRDGKVFFSYNQFLNFLGYGFGLSFSLSDNKARSIDSDGEWTTQVCDLTAHTKTTQPWRAIKQ